MKKLTLLFLFTVTFFCYGKAQWMQLPQDTDLQNCSVYFLNPDTGFVVGDVGFLNTFIQRTMDGGLTWDTTLIANSLMQMTVFFPDDTTGYTSGQDGGFYKTTDMGTNWYYASSLPFVGDDVGDIYFTSKDTGFVSDFSGRIFKTTDGALTWTTVSYIPNSPQNYFPGTGKFQFLNDSTGFLANGNYGKVLMTTDRGNNWTSIDLPSASTWALSIYMFNKDTGMVTAESGKIWHTVNGGLSWTQTTIPGSFDLLDVTFFNDSVGYIVGGGDNTYGFHGPPYTPVGGIIYVTYDAGTTWNVDTAMCCDWMTSICNAGNNVAYVAGWTSRVFKLDSANVNTSIHENSVQNGIKIYPNPVSDMLYIANENSEFHFEITDVSGRVILSGENKNEIDLSGFSEGMYFLTLRTKEEILSEKIIVRH